jgi:hypothetical protein
MVKGKLDADGFARIDGVPSGECNVRFPEHEEAGAIPERQDE